MFVFKEKKRFIYVHLCVNICIHRYSPLSQSVPYATSLYEDLHDYGKGFFLKRVFPKIPLYFS